MKVTIVYESMFGATRTVAEAIARGVREAGGHRTETVLRRVVDADAADVGATDVLVVGAPTHVHSLSRPASRTEAGRWAQGEKPGLALEPHALERGAREFLDELPSASIASAAFGTRAEGPEIFTGSAARTIAKRLRRKGFVALLPDESFLVDGESRLVEGEEGGAYEFGRALATHALTRAPQHVGLDA